MSMSGKITRLQRMLLAFCPIICTVYGRLPPDGADDSTRRRLIKAAFTRRFKKDGIDIRKNHLGAHDLRQRRYWEQTMREQDDCNRDTDYIHVHPVKHGYVDAVPKWPH